MTSENTNEDNNMILLSDPAKGSVAKASSVLQKNTKLYGPMNALDIENKMTSWNSDGTSSGKQRSWYVIDFGVNRVVIPSKIKIQFQAGFVAEVVTVQIQSSSSIEGGEKWENLIDIEEIEDVHGIQSFDLFEGDTTKVPQKKQVKAIKLIFEECTDFYGRVIIYQLQVWGSEIHNNNESSSSTENNENNNTPPPKTTEGEDK